MKSTVYSIPLEKYITKGPSSSDIVKSFIPVFGSINICKSDLGDSVIATKIYILPDSGLIS